MKDLTVVIPFYNGHQTITSLLNGLPAELPVIVVDDLSERPLQLNTNRDIRIIRSPEKGYFSGAVNTGVAACDTDVLVLNQDVTLTGTRWLDMLAENRGEYALIGDGVMGHPAWPMGYVQGTFMYMRRDAIERVGGLNAEQYPLWGSTCEWQLRICRADFHALPLTSIEGFMHLREKRPYGSAISQVLQDEPERRDLFIQTPPKISVVTSSYNYGRYLPDLVYSLIGGPTSLGDHPGQTCQSFELIIVNDTSQDDTADIAKALADPWKGIRYIELPPANHADGMPNNGTPVANNAGIAAAHGRYIAVIGGDDMMEPTRLADMLAVQEANPHAMVYDDFMEFANGERTAARNMADYSFESLLQQNHVHAGIMFPRKAWEEVGGYPEAMRYGREDWAFNVALGIHGYCGIRVAEPSYLYRRENQGRSTRNTTPEWRRRFRDQMHRLFPEIYGGYRPMACCGRGRQTPKPKGGPVAMSINHVGQEGMTLLRYQGANAGTQQWPGLNGRTYVFGLSRPVGYVDSRDVEHMLTKYWDDGNNRSLFIIVLDDDASLDVAPDEAKQINPPVAMGGSATMPVVDSNHVFNSEEEFTEAGPTHDPSEYNVKELRVLVKSFPLDTLQAMLVAEQAGKNRPTALSAIEAAIKKIEEEAE